MALMQVAVEALKTIEQAAAMVATGDDAAKAAVAPLLAPALDRLRSGDQDQEVKESAIRCDLGVVHSGALDRSVWHCHGVVCLACETGAVFFF